MSSHTQTGLVSVGLMFWLATDSDKTNVQRRLAIIGALGVMQGCSIGPLVQVALYVDPRYVLQLDFSHTYIHTYIYIYIYIYMCI